MISETLDKYSTALNYACKTLLVLSGASSGVSLFSSTTVIGTPVRIVSASISLVFFVGNEINKMFLKTMGRKKTNTEILRSCPDVIEPHGKNDI